MSLQPDTDLLFSLRRSLRHFEETGDNELSPDAAEIKELLLRRIGEIEHFSHYAALGHTPENHRYNPTR